MKKLVAQLDQAGVFLGLTSADESPLEPGVWLIPGGAVDAVPPEIPPGRRARWNGENFDLEDVEPQLPPRLQMRAQRQPESSLEQRIADLRLALEAHYDNKAAERSYSSWIACAVRAGYSGRLHSDAMAFVQWMDQCNEKAAQVFADAVGGVHPLPALGEFLASMPEMEWPL